MEEKDFITRHVTAILECSSYLELKKYIVPKYSPIVKSDWDNKEKTKEVSEYFWVKMFYMRMITTLWFKHIYDNIKKWFKKYVNRNN